MILTGDGLAGACGLGFRVFGFGLSFSIALAQSALALAGAGWLAARIATGRFRWGWGGLAAPLLGFLAASGAGAWAGREWGFHGPDLAKAALLPLILPLTLTLASERPEWAKRAWTLLFLGSGIHVLYALGLWLGEAQASGTFFARLHGAFNMPQTYGEIAAMVLCFGLFAQAGLGRWERWIKGGLLLAVALTQIRGAYLGLIAGLGAAAMLRWPRRALRITGASLLLVAAWGSLRFTVDLERTGVSVRRLLDPFGLSTLSNQYRWQMLRLGGRMIAEHPLGVGPGNVLAVFPAYVPPELEGWKAQPSFGHLHNNLAQVAAERGLPGLGFFGWLVAALGLSLFRRAGEGGPAAGALAAGAVFLASGLTEYTLGDSEVAMVFWFLCGLGLAPASGRGGGRGSI
jgi:O-antigen ligase